MNALELVDELVYFMTEDKYTDLDKAIFKAATMLRQQHAEIEALKAMNDKLKEVIETSIDRHNAIARMK